MEKETKWDRFMLWIYEKAFGWILLICALGVLIFIIVGVPLLCGGDSEDTSHKLIDGQCYKRIEEDSGAYDQYQITYLKVDMIYCN